MRLEIIAMRTARLLKSRCTRFRMTSRRAFLLMTMGGQPKFWLKKSETCATPAKLANTKLNPKLNTHCLSTKAAIINRIIKQGAVVTITKHQVCKKMEEIIRVVTNLFLGADIGVRICWASTMIITINNRRSSTMFIRVIQACCNQCCKIVPDPTTNLTSSNRNKLSAPLRTNSKRS